VQHERSNQKKLETTKGWYSEPDLKYELGWKPTLDWETSTNTQIYSRHIYLNNLFRIIYNLIHFHYSIFAF
jgi:hypothetical protein